MVTWQICCQHPKAASEVLGTKTLPRLLNPSSFIRNHSDNTTLGQAFLSIKEIDNNNVLKIKAKSREATAGTE